MYPEKNEGGVLDLSPTHEIIYINAKGVEELREVRILNLTYILVPAGAFTEIGWWMHTWDKTKGSYRTFPMTRVRPVYKDYFLHDATG